MVWVAYLGRVVGQEGGAVGGVGLRLMPNPMGKRNFGLFV